MADCGTEKSDFPFRWYDSESPCPKTLLSKPEFKFAAISSGGCAAKIRGEEAEEEQAEDSAEEPPAETEEAKEKEEEELEEEGGRRAFLATIRLWEGRRGEEEEAAETAERECWKESGLSGKEAFEEANRDGRSEWSKAPRKFAPIGRDLLDSMEEKEGEKAKAACGKAEEGPEDKAAEGATGENPTEPPDRAVGWLEAPFTSLAEVIIEMEYLRTFCEMAFILRCLQLELGHSGWLSSLKEAQWTQGKPAAILRWNDSKSIPRRLVQRPREQNITPQWQRTCSRSETAPHLQMWQLL